jgi:hypothetical protein
MDEQFRNPIIMTVSLLDGYKALIRNKLEDRELDDQILREIIEDLRIDNGVYFSPNPTYNLSVKAGPPGFLDCG